jgi:hypothetical protein
MMSAPNKDALHPALLLQISHRVMIVNAAKCCFEA